MAQDLGLIRTYLPQCFREGIPARYAGYLGRKCGFNPALISYENYLLITPAPIAVGYETLLKGSSGFFSEEDREYILRGAYVKDPNKWIRQADKTVVAARNAKKAA
jgi:hypothetical protein